jgi:hypothetical protein
MPRSLVIEDLRCRFADQNAGIAFFYCDYRDQDHQTARNIIASILKQLSSQSLSLPAPVTNLHSRLGGNSEQPPLKELESTLQLVCQGFDQTFIIIDALDECDTKKHRDNLLGVLRGLDKSLIRILVTSRPYLGDLIRNLSTYPQIRIEAKATDVRMFLAQKIDEDREVAELFDPVLREEAISAISQAAQGMYVAICSSISQQTRLMDCETGFFCQLCKSRSS